MRNTQEHKKIDALLVLVLLGTFAVCILFVLLTCADAYQRLARRDQLSYDRRTAQQYLTTRVHQADRMDGITIASFGDADALVLREQINGEDYQTLVYCHDGYLRELFALAGSEFTPSDGEKVLQAQSLSLQWQDRLLLLDLTDPSGQTQRITIYPRSGKGDVP